MLGMIAQKLKTKFFLTNDKFISQLRERGMLIGDNVCFFSPANTTMDLGKAFLIKIGNHCKITKGVTILAHDYSRSVCRFVYGENIGGSAPVTIGDNCFIGMNAMILMNTNIGSNCIVGANSVVSGTFPDNVVIAGNPARVICTLEEYRQKRKSKCLQEAVLCVKAVYENTGKLPTVAQMGDGYAWLYLPRTTETIQKYPRFFDLAGDDQDSIIKDFMATKPQFNNFEEFLNYACSQADIKINGVF